MTAIKHWPRSTSNHATNLPSYWALADNSFAQYKVRGVLTLRDDVNLYALDSVELIRKPIRISYGALKKSLACLPLRLRG